MFGCLCPHVAAMNLIRACLIVHATLFHGVCAGSGLDEVGEDEELQYDPTAYDCMHVMSLDWPCLR